MIRYLPTANRTVLESRDAQILKVMGGQQERRFRTPDGLAAERRGSLRFGLELEIRYVVLGANPPESAIGKTIDISSSGIRFVARRPLSPGAVLDIALDWPAALHGTVPLQLAGTAMVVRTSDCETAVRLLHHQFKTRSREKPSGS